MLLETTMLSSHKTNQPHFETAKQTKSYFEMYRMKSTFNFSVVLVFAVAFTSLVASRLAGPSQSIQRNLVEVCTDNPLSAKWNAGGSLGCDFYEDQCGTGAHSKCDQEDFKNSCCYCGGGTRSTPEDAGEFMTE